MSGRKILIVEDESIVALDLQDCLTRFGYQVVGVETYGEKALALARSTQAELVLMDIMLKGTMDGIQACGAIKDALGLPVIFLTAYADESTLQRAKILTPDGYLLKPFDAEELRVAIEMALHRASLGGDTPRAVPAAAAGEEPASIDEAASVLAGAPVFSAIPEKERAALLENAVMRQLDAGEVWCEEGSKLDRAFILLSGRAALVKSSANGKELLVEILAPGDALSVLVGINAERAPTTVRAQAPSRLLELPLNTLRTMANELPSFQRAAMQFLLQRLNRSHERARALAHDTAEERLCSSLLLLAPYLARAQRPGGSYAIYITRQELADVAGTTPETAIRVTKALERDGVLELSRPGIVRVEKPEALESLSGGSSAAS